MYMKCSHIFIIGDLLTILRHNFWYKTIVQVFQSGCQEFNVKKCNFQNQESKYKVFPAEGRESMTI